MSFIRLHLLQIVDVRRGAQQQQQSTGNFEQEEEQWFFCNQRLSNGKQLNN